MIYSIKSKNYGFINLSNEPICKGDLCYDLGEDMIGECLRTHPDSYYNKYCKKVVICQLDGNGECLNCDETLDNCKCYKLPKHNFLKLVNPKSSPFMEYLQEKLKISNILY